MNNESQEIEPDPWYVRAFFLFTVVGGALFTIIFFIIEMSK